VKRKRTQSGLTLLEVLVAIGILGIILTVVYGAYTTNADTIQSARKMAEINQVARIVLDLISKDLQCAIVEVPDESGEVTLAMLAEDLEIDDRPADKIDFTSLNHLALGPQDLRTDLCEIGYYLKEDEEQEMLILYRRDDPTVDDRLTEGGSSFELAQRVGGLNFIFLNPFGEEFDSWDTSDEGFEEQLPALIKIALILLDEQGYEHVFTTSVHPSLAKTER
jgi:prepilin-type N-terminal cleavage/methylation domain-containing protein